MRRLVINADDFGLTGGINRAILEAHQRGVVTSATLMASGASFAEATRMALSAPSLGVGCHVVLVDGTSTLPTDQVRTLLDPATRQFRQSFAELMRSTGKLAPMEVECEAGAQISKLQAAGIAVTHVDAHKHIHVFPEVLRPLLRAAKACGVNAVRAPFDRFSLWQLAKPTLWKRTLAACGFHRYAGAFRRAVRDAGMTSPDGCLGIVATGALNVKIFTEIISTIPEGTWEFVCHPGYVDAELATIRTRLRESRVQELQVLTSPAAREALAKRSVELISFRQLADHSSR